jgi:putative membrane protein
MQSSDRILTTVATAAAIFCVLYSAPSRAAAQSAQPSLDDPTIVAIFDAANTYDVETGATAVRKGNSSAVREFGAMLERDHRNVRDMGRNLARSLNVTPTPPKDFALTKAHIEAMKSLNALTGREFDRAFLQHEIDFHNAVINAVTTSLLPATQNAQLKDLETKIAPAFVAHRDRAQSLLNDLK